MGKTKKPGGKQKGGQGQGSDLSSSTVGPKEKNVKTQGESGRDADFFSNVFAESSEDDEEAVQQALIQVKPPAPAQRQKKKKVKQPEIAIVSNNSSSRAKEKGRKKGMRESLLAAADSDTDNDEEEGKKKGYEFENDDTSSDEEEPELIACVTKPGSSKSKRRLPPDEADVDVKDEIMESESETDIKAQADMTDEDNDEEKDSAKSEQEDEDLKRTEIRKELANLTFEELEKLKEQMGLTLYNEAMFGVRSKKKLNKRKQQELFKRTNKNRPREISARIRVPMIREVAPVKKIVKRDPRFDDSYGPLDKDQWDQDYEFLREIQKKEVEDMEKSLKKEERDNITQEKRTEIKKYIQKFRNQETTKQMKVKELEKRKQRDEDNKKRVAEGKRPFYVKKSTQKVLDLAEKYEELKASGKLEKYLKKKRRKNQTRDKRSIAAFGSKV